MWRNALQRSWMSSVTDRSAGIEGVCATVAILLTAGGCSNFQSLIGAPQQPSLHVAEAALSAGAPDSALRVADLADAKQPNDARTLTAKGDALYAMGQRELAQTAYRAAVAIDPSAVAAQVGLGRTLAQSDPQAAEAAFLAALKHDPNNVVALNDLGVMWDVQGRHEEAQKAYRHALSVSPKATEAEVNLGRSLALSGHAGDARELLHAIAADPAASQQWRAEIAAALNVAGDAQSAQRLLLAGSAEPGPTGVSAAHIAQSRGPAPPLSPSGLEMARNALAERFADATTANGNLPADAPPRPVSAPRIAVAQSELPPILPRMGATALHRDAPEATGAGNAPSGSKVKIDAVAKASEVTGAISTLSATEPGGPPDRRAVKQEPANSAEQSSAPPNAPYVQLASLLSENDAMFEWNRLSKRFSDLLTAREPTITTAGVNGRTYWRLRTFGFADMKEAKDLCTRLIQAGWRCFSGRDL